MKKKIFYIDPQSMRNLSVYDYNLLSEVTDEVYYYCSKYHDYKKNSSFKYKYVFSYNYLGSKPRKALSYILSYMFILWDILIKKPDVIHIQWFKIPTFDIAFYTLVKKVSNAKLVLTAHNVIPHNTGNKYTAKFTKLYHLMDRISVHADRTKEEIANDFGVDKDKITVVHHGLLSHTYNKKKYEDELSYYEEKYQLKGKFVLISLGEQSKYKGIDQLIKVWTETPELANDNSCKLLIVGKKVGLDYTKISKLNNVYLEDKKISNEEFFYLLKHADVYLFTYRKISISGALFTALNEKVPVLVTDVGGIADPLKIAKVGWSIPNLDGLKKGLEYIIAHKEESEAIKSDKNAWAKINEYYNWHTISKENQKLYDSLF